LQKRLLKDFRHMFHHDYRGSIWPSFRKKHQCKTWVRHLQCLLP